MGVDRAQVGRLWEPCVPRLKADASLPASNRGGQSKRGQAQGLSGAEFFNTRVKTHPLSCEICVGLATRLFACLFNGLD